MTEAPAKELQMTQAEHYAINMAAWYVLKETIDTKYPRGQFVAIARGKIVGDDADLYKLNDKLAALGIDRMESLVDRAGAPRPGRAIFPGMMKLAAAERARWSSETRTEA
jgi:hypothetical protein